MRTITTNITVYDFDELSSDAQERAIDALRAIAVSGWDESDNEGIRETMVYTLAEKFRTPGWDTYGVGDFPGIPNVTLDGWDLDRSQSLALSGMLDRDNAPALPWVRGLSSVTLTGRRSTDTWLTGNDDLADRWTATTAEYAAMEQAIRNAIGDARQAGEREYEYQTGEDRARERAIDREFTADGKPY